MKFSGFRSDAWTFFRQLKRNNHREWFLKNRPRYDKWVIAPSVQLVRTLETRPAFKKLGLSNLEKNPLYRINRDLRFSLDKSPYKTHNGLVLTRTGNRKDSSGCFYLHLEPSGCFMAAGFWQPPPALLYLFRRWIVENPVKAKRTLYPLIKKPLEDESRLSRLPRGFESITDPTLQELLKRKSWIAGVSLPEKSLGSSTLVGILERFLIKASPLLQIGWPILDAWRADGGDPEWQQRQRKAKDQRFGHRREPHA